MDMDSSAAGEDGRERGKLAAFSVLELWADGKQEEAKGLIANFLHSETRLAIQAFAVDLLGFLGPVFMRHAEEDYGPNPRENLTLVFLDPLNEPPTGT
ncbi:MAG: hypothetical protein WEE36_06810 [Acidimicrobiia bacterium]